MTVTKKKILPRFFDDILNGKKNFEVRIADFDCKEGDTLILEEWDAETKKYTGRKIEKKIKYLLKTKEQDFYKKEDIEKFGYAVIGFD